MCVIFIVYSLYYTVKIAVDCEIRYLSLVSGIWTCIMIEVCWINHIECSFIDKVFCTYFIVQLTVLHKCVQVV